MSTQIKSRPSWLLRSSAELLVIVVGVLLALSLENWWSERQELALEVGYIDALNLEAQSRVDALQINQGAHDRKHAALSAAINLLNEPFKPETTPELFHGLFQGSGIPVVPEFSTAVFVDLQSSGRLRLIRDSGLRRALIDHYTRIPTQIQRAQRWAEATDSTLHSFISSRAPAGTVRQEGPTLQLDWSDIAEDELHEIGAEIHSHAEVRRLVNAQARLLEEERNWLEIMTRDLEEFAGLFEEVAP